MQCGLKSQLAYIYIYMCTTSVTLRNANKSQVTFLIRAITMSVCSVYVSSVMERFRPRGPPGGPSTCSRWRPDQLHECRF